MLSWYALVFFRKLFFGGGGWFVSREGPKHTLKKISLYGICNRESTRSYNILLYSAIHAYKIIKPNYYFFCPHLGNIIGKKWRCWVGREAQTLPVTADLWEVACSLAARVGLWGFFWSLQSFRISPFSAPSYQSSVLGNAWYLGLPWPNPFKGGSAWVLHADFGVNRMQKEGLASRHPFGNPGDCWHRSWMCGRGTQESFGCGRTGRWVWSPSPVCNWD